MGLILMSEIDRVSMQPRKSLEWIRDNRPKWKNAAVGLLERLDLYTSLCSQFVEMDNRYEDDKVEFNHNLLCLKTACEKHKLKNATKEEGEAIAKSLSAMQSSITHQNEILRHASSQIRGVWDKFVRDTGMLIECVNEHEEDT